MFDSLQSRLGATFDRLRGRGALSEADVEEALKDIRTALVEADVALPVVKDFIDKVRPRAVGADVIRSVTPGQLVVKIVHDVLVETLGTENATLNLGSPPAPILMVGLQGSGKTTTSAKLASMLTTREKKKVLMASLDVSRPAAMEQLRVLGEQAGVPTLPIVAGQGPIEIAKRAMASAKVGGYDVLILDTAGRRHRRAVDGGSRSDQGAGQSARDIAGRGLADRSGRGEHREVVQRARFAQRHHSHACGWRCARRCGAIDARGHRCADQIPRRRRKAGRA